MYTLINWRPLEINLHHALHRVFFLFERFSTCFSDAVLKFLVANGNGSLVNHVENIDKQYSLGKLTSYSYNKYYNNDTRGCIYKG